MTAAEVFQYLKEVGPYSAPLCLVMGLAIRWLLKDRARILGLLEKSHETTVALQEKRLQQLQQSTGAYMEFSQAQSAKMDEWNRRADQVLISLSQQKGS